MSCSRVPGADQFVIVLENGAPQKRKVLQFPNQTTQYGPSLREQLQLLLGEAGVVTVMPGDMAARAEAS